VVIPGRALRITFIISQILAAKGLGVISALAIPRVCSFKIEKPLIADPGLLHYRMAA
jgi:hypothetical protein